MSTDLNINMPIKSLFLFMLVIVTGLSCTQCHSYQAPKSINVDLAFHELNIKKLDSVALTQSIHRSANMLMELLGDNGQFNYKVNLDTSVRVKPKYNSLRHAGGIYALCMYYEFSKEATSLEAAIRASDFMKKFLIAPLKKRPELLGVWSRGDINNDNDPNLVKLGGNGLGLLSLAYLEKLKPGTTDIDTLRMMGDFILYMQKKNGGFYSKYIPKGGRDDSWTSLYYPGEAALGLLMLYDIDKDQRWLEAAAKALSYLEQLRKGKTAVEADHWALIATHKLLTHFNDLDSSYEPDPFIQHGIQITKSIIRDLPQFPSYTPYYGCMTPDGRTTPTATRLEGLLSFVKSIPEERKSLIYSTLLVSNKGVSFLESAQIKEGEYSGAMTRALSGPNINPAKFGMSPDAKRDTEVRIDYIQHSLSAWIQYYDLVYGVY